VKAEKIITWALVASSSGFVLGFVAAAVAMISGALDVAVVAAWIMAGCGFLFLAIMAIPLLR